MNYEQVLQALYHRNEFSIKLGLENIKTLLNYLDNPLKSFPVIHIAGTNGKGSVANFLSSILKEEGFKVGLYTSPHLIDFRERIQINHKKIPKKDVLQGLSQIDRVIEKEQQKDKHFAPTYFEVVTALALKYFQKQQIQIAVLETGLGGRLDSTNVCSPLVSVVTNIGKDHTSILGKTLASIAKEKAGIIKKGIPVVTAETRKSRLKILQQEAKKKKADLISVPKIISEQKETFSYEGDSWNLPNLQLSMLGEYQIKNAFTAITALEQLKETEFKVSLESIRKGLSQAQWPGRFEILKEKPLLIVDGAHNPEGIDAFIEALKAKEIKNPILIFGLMQDKEKQVLIQKLNQISETFYLVASNTPKAMPVQALEKLFLKSGYSGSLNLSYTLSTALSKALKQGRKEKRAICVCGSLYLVGETLSYLEKENAKN